VPRLPPSPSCRPAEGIDGRTEFHAQLDAVVLQMYSASIVLSEVVREFKKQFVPTVLRDVNWKQSKGAQALGMHRNASRALFASWNLTSARFAKPSAVQLVALALGQKKIGD
jgi:hypothetical protein